MAKDNDKHGEFAKLHYDYTDDADLFIIADRLDAEHGEGMLLWAYWPQIISAAKKAKSFGWFRKAPKMLAQALNDHECLTNWEPRRLMFELLVERNRIVVRQGKILTASEMVDVRPMQWEPWQSMSSRETSRLTRERKQFAAGNPVHWTVEHLEEFRHRVTSDTTTPPVLSHAVTENDHRVTENGHGVTTRDKTRQDETREDQPIAAAPPDEHDQRKQFQTIGQHLPADPLDNLAGQVLANTQQHITDKLAEVLDRDDAARIAGSIVVNKIGQPQSDRNGGRRRYDAATWLRAVNVTVRKITNGLVLTGDPTGFIISLLPDYTEPYSDREVVIAKTTDDPDLRGGDFGAIRGRSATAPTTSSEVA